MHGRRRRKKLFGAQTDSVGLLQKYATGRDGRDMYKGGDIEYVVRRYGCIRAD